MLVDECSSMISGGVDVIQTHILTRLDGPTLASASCASSELHALIEEDEDHLWRNISSATWPSTNTPPLQRLISAFPHRSFFAHAYPPSTRTTTTTTTTTSSCNLKKLISAVDILYTNKDKDDVILVSKVHELEETQTDTTWFLSTPFRLDLLDPPKATMIQSGAGGGHPLENHMRLSWIVMDQTSKRAANLSSFTPLTVQRHWFTGDMQVRFGTVVVSTEDGSNYYCGILVAVMMSGGVREVSMQIEDVDGRILNGEESMVILQGILECDSKGGGRRGEEGKERYLDYLEMKRERVERKERRERNSDMLCITLAFSIFIAFCSLLLL